MKFLINRNRIYLSLREYILLLGVPIAISACTIWLINSNKSYTASVLIMQNSPLFSGIKGRHLAQAGLKPNAIKMIRTQSRQLEHGSLTGRVEKIVILTSRDFLSQYLLEYALKPKLFEKRWDNELKQWKTKEPSDYYAVKRLIKRIKIKEKKNFITISLKWSNAKESAILVNEFVNFANKYIASKEDANIAQQIRRINEMLLDETPPKHLHKKFLESRKASLISMRDTRLPSQMESFSVIDPALPPIKASFKLPLILLIAQLLLSFFLIYVVILARHIKRSSRH